jgi:diketogulonate reductase-like aldo/keto reductase
VYKTETELGLGIKESRVDREKLYVVTKAVKGDDLENTLKTSLKKLQLDYVDLYGHPYIALSTILTQQQHTATSSTLPSGPNPTKNCKPPGQPWKS